MQLIDWILNLACILLWIDWRSGRLNRHPHPIYSLASTVRATERRMGSGLGSIAVMFLILLIRPLFYHTLGSRVEWTPDLDLIAISIPWRSDLMDRMYIYSTLSFLLAIGFFYAAMLLLGAVNRHLPDDDVMQRFVRLQLGWLEKLPWWMKLVLPSVVAGLAWVCGAPMLYGIGLLPTAPPSQGSWDSALAFALAPFLAWKWVLIVFFGLHWLNIYVYLGTHPVWPYISLTSRKLLRPLSFLTFPKLDLAPAMGMVVVFVLAEFVIKAALVSLFRKFTG